MSREVWEHRYSTPPRRIPVYDGWLNEWVARFSGRGVARILDLGCGRGTDAVFLTRHGFTVVYSDFVFNATDFVNENLNLHRGILVDHSAPLPFHNASFDAAVGNLSLHYFADDSLRRILAEIARVLRPTGMILSRFNSVRDSNYGARPDSHTVSGTVEGVTKQFFTRERVEQIFEKSWKTESIREYGTECFGPRKEVIEVSAILA